MEMKGIALLMVLAALTAGCEKAEQDPVIPEKESYLQEITSTVYYSPEEFISYISDIVPAISNELLNSPEVKKLGFGIAKFPEMVEMDTYDIFEKCNFTYRSLDVFGNPVVLSGSAMFINTTYPGKSHVMDDVTLYQPYWLSMDECGTGKGSPAMVRAAYNQLVVVPDFQGFGITQGIMHNPFLEYSALARQSIDCEMAALELMDSLGIDMRCGYRTYNMGMSKGAPVAMAAQKLLENSEPRQVRNRIALKSTYCCSGPYDLIGLTEKYIEKGEERNLWMIALMVTSAYYSHPDIFAGYSIEDFFTDKFNQVRVEKDGKMISLTEWIDLLYCDEHDMIRTYREYGLTSVADIFAPRFFDAEGRLNLSDPLVSAFVRVHKENDPSQGWSPATQLVLEHSKDDNFVVYDISYSCYERLKKDSDGNENPYVRESTWSGLDHEEISVVGMLKMFFMRDPTVTLPQ